MNRFAFVTAATFACSLAFSAHAAPGDAAAAEVLFKEARELVSKEKFEEACPKFEESQKLDPGMGTLYNLADCYSHIGRNASAWAAFSEVADAARQAGQKEREEDARRRAKDAEKLLAYLTITIHQPVDGLIVSRNGVTVGKGQLGTRIPVDDGEHLFKATAPGKLDWEKKVVVHGETKFEVPPLVDAPVDPAAGKVATKETIVIKDHGGTQRIVGWSLVGAGGVSMVLGGVFGLNAISKYNQSNEKGGCSTSTNLCTDPSGPTLRDEGRTAGTLSTVFFVGGGVLAAAGIATVLLAPKRVEERVTETKGAFHPWASPEALGGAFEGTF